MGRPPKKRRCDNWIETFLNWTLQRSEAPISLLTWSGLFTLASTVKRKVYFPRTLMGSYEIYPSIYVIFVGPPGVVRKSTTAGYTEELIEKVNTNVISADPNYIHLGPTAGSSSKLLEKMAALPEGAITIIASEFGNLVSTTPEGMYDLFTRFFDNPEEFLYSTRQYGDEYITRPTLNLLGCTTPGWVSENTGYMIDGGFASRVIFVFEQQARRRKMYYDDIELSPKQIAQMEEDLVYDLRLIANLEGPFSHETVELRDEMEAWYQAHAESEVITNAEGFHSRKHVHVHKVAMLLSLAQSSDLIITKVHFDTALALIDDIERKLSRGLSIVGRNPYSADLYRIIDFIASEGPIEKRFLFSKFWQDLLPEELSKILEVLKITEQIEEVADESGVIRIRITS